MSRDLCDLLERSDTFLSTKFFPSTNAHHGTQARLRSPWPLALRTIDPPTPHPKHSSLLRPGKHISRRADARLQSPTQTPLRRDAFDAVRRVDVLDERDLVAGRGALARGDGGVGEEELPDLIDTDGKVSMMYFAEGEKGREGNIL